MGAGSIVRGHVIEKAKLNGTSSCALFAVKNVAFQRGYAANERSDTVLRHAAALPILAINIHCGMVVSTKSQVDISWNTPGPVFMNDNID